MVCINCGVDCSDAAKICVNCGAILPKNNEVEASNDDIYLARGKKRRKKNKTLIILLFSTPIILFILFLLFLFILGSIE